jgi:hypothetical protein
MLRSFACAAFALVLSAVVVLAAEYKNAKVKSVDTDKNTITVTIDDKDKTFKIAKDDFKVMRGEKEMKGGLKAKAFSDKNIEKGLTVTLITDGEGAKEVVKEVRLKGKKKN